MKTGQLLSLAWRESRFARRRLFLFVSAISLGVAALVAVQGFAANMQREVSGQAQAMLGADVTLSARQPFGERTEAVLDSAAASGVAMARVTSFASMVINPATNSTRLVQVRAPEPGFPFYGVIETEPADQWRRLQEGRNIIVDPALLVAIAAEVGDSVAVGATRFQIIASLQKLPGDVEVASSFAPRVFFPSAYLEETELLGFGARIEYEAFLRIDQPLQAQAFVDRYGDDVFRSERVRSRTVADQQERMAEALGNLSNFLGLIGVFALLLGGIGVASAMSAYMARKVDTVAVLRCLGATSPQILGIYLLQAAVMGLAGAAVGVTLGAAVQWVIPRLLEGLLPVDVVIRPDRVAVLTGIVVGLWTAIAFALIPLLSVRRISPLMALRRRVEPIAATGFDWAKWVVAGALAASVALLIVYQAGELDVGLSVSAGIAGTLFVLWLAARVVSLAMRKMPAGGFTYTVRQGIANLHRPGNQTVTVVLALGFGAFLIATLILTQANILRPLMVDTENRGNLLFFDVQQDQVDTVLSVLASRDMSVIQSAPLIPMRIAAVEGVEVLPPADGAGGFEDFDDDLDGDAPGSGERDGDVEVAADVNADVDGGGDGERNASGGGAGSGNFDGGNRRGPPGGWAIRREYRSTYRDSLAATETLVAGEWWEPGRSGPRDVYEVSLDQEVANELGVGIGGRIDWNVQGVIVPTRVTSLRRIDWARLEPNFYAVFEPSALIDAPQMWILLARGDSARSRGQAQGDIVSRYPNISAIDLTLVQRALDDVLGRISLVIRFLAAFSVATGFIVLLGAVSSGRLQRIRESVLLKTLGATRRQIGAILFTEYALLGLLAVVVGCGLSIGAGYGLARWLFNVGFVVEPLPLLGLAGAIALLSAVIGLSASRDVFRSTPMEAIREE